MVALIWFLLGLMVSAQPDEDPPGPPGSLTAGDSAIVESAAEPAASDPMTEAAALTAQIAQGTLSSDGRPVAFWREQFAIALTDTGGGVFDVGVLRAFLAVVQKEGLPQPFRFTAGEELREAAGILGVEDGTQLQQLYRELLAAELNLASGRSWVANPEQIQRLIRWVESVIADAEAAAEGTVVAPEAEPPAEEPEPALRVAHDFLIALNTGGGGGVDE